MAKAKNVVYGYATGSTLYAIIVRAEDSYVLDSTDGTFKASLAACTDPYCNLTESATILGRYAYATSAAVWNDGNYTATIYLQAGGSPSVAADTVLDSVSVYIAGDTVSAAEAPTAGALCTLAAVKSALNITTSAKDSLISTLIDDVTAWIQNDCRRVFSSTSHTEVFSPGFDHRVIGNGTILIPREYPIISVTSLHESSVRTFDATSLIAATDYAIGQGNLFIELLDDGATVAFDAGRRTVQLVYVAGYATIPSDLQRAAVMLAVDLYYKADRQKQNIASENLGGVTVSYLNEAIPKAVNSILARYRRPCGM